VGDQERVAHQIRVLDKVLTESITPGISILPSISFTSRRTSHSSAWLGLAASIE
jgi:hypothetical protein